MKIVKISFENINNLKGPQEVDFSAEPLASAGLFAIIGPTGSGKSTLLDVITLALFNRVPRFKGSLSKNSITDMGAIMTHHTTNAAANIEYKIHNHHYTSKWEISTARTGNLRDYHMEIMDEQSGSIITDKKTEVPSKNESIIGLNYDQFVKSIILAQGDFSKFLQATKNERGQLLENITGASIYRTIGQAAFQKHKEAKLEITAKQNILENTKVLTEEARSQIIQDIASAEEQKSVLDLEIKRLADILHIKKTLQEIDEGIVQKDKLRTSIIADINAFTPQLKRLQLHDKINPLRGDVSLYVNAKENAQTHRNHLAKHQKELKEISQALAKVLDDMSSLTSEEVSSSNFRVVMTSFEKEVNKLDADLAHISSKGIDQRQRITDKIKASTLSLTNKTDPHDALDLLDQSSTALKASITSAQIDESSNIDTLKEKLRADRSNLALLKEYAHARDHVHDASKKIEDAENKLKQLATDLEKNKPLLEKSQALLRAYQENNASLNKRKEDALKIASLEKLRPTLQDGEPCPLCGSVSHPYTTHLPDHGGDVIDDEIAKNQKLIDQETTAEKKLTNTITSISTSEKLSKEQLIEATQQHKQASIKLKDVEDKISDDKYKTAEKIGTHLDALEHTIGNLEKGIEALQQLNINQELTKEFTNLKNITAEYQLLAKTRKEKSSVKDVSAKCNALQDQFNQYTTRKQGTTKAIEIESSSLDKAQNDVQTLATKLTPHLQKNGFKSVEDINSVLLEDNERQKLQHTYDELTTSHTAVETELKNLHSAKKKNSALDSQPTLPIIDVEKNIKKNEFKRESIVSTHGANKNALKHDDELITNRKTQQATIDKLTVRLEKWALLDSLIGDSTGNTFSNFAQGLTLQHLLALANQRLQNLSDRYLLAKPDGDDVLQIVDAYQGNTMRAVTTLSGGETFLLSLALALSLSDMASKNVPLDSLFIDEGFGTLDQETLDMAMDTLERLQSESQKTVGVISHVEALKERIHVQIKLKKNGQGYSEVEVG